eukprot:TRINITY_DN93042_c0_g1_i1.p2 TRINITY_DN93042_c0_g1~~TRINITY_DN93042_c0_g1_i1.p2  ORF type:complete len:168 (+),score=7.73 TRINITY_DN93042_c0_g1_i1:442-945(+)
MEFSFDNPPKKESLGDDLPKYGFCLKMICDESVKDNPEISYNETDCSIYTVFFKHASCINFCLKNIGCPKTYVEAVWSFFGRFYYIFGTALIVIGVVYAFFGLRFRKAVTIISFVILTYAVVCGTVYTYKVPNPSKIWVHVPVLGSFMPAINKQEEPQRQEQHWATS